MLEPTVGRLARRGRAVRAAADRRGHHADRHASACSASRSASSLLGGALTSVFVGIAAQQSLSNVFAGIVLLLARPFRVGDSIRLQAGALGGQISGTIVEVGITYVRLATSDRRDLHPELPGAQRRRRPAPRPAVDPQPPPLIAQPAAQPSPAPPLMAARIRSARQPERARR